MSQTEGEQTVRAFLAAFAERDIEKIMSYVTDDFRYHNIPVPVIEGKENVRAIFQFFLDEMDPIDLEVIDSVSAGDKVFVERVDHMTAKGGHVDLPVGGFFELRDGKISKMHEYFDLATLSDATGLPLAL